MHTPQIAAGAYTLKVAGTPDDFRQIHRLNYQTFVREIPQHADPGNGKLVDKFHKKNLYILAKRAGRVVGMVAVHDEPPFSVAAKLDDPSVIASGGWRPLEVRLLAVEPGERHRVVVGALMWALFRYAAVTRHTHLLISGIVERVDMYERLGFRALGPAKESGGASFVPMAMEVDRLSGEIRHGIESWERRMGLPLASPGSEPVSLMPGPVQIAPEVLAALNEPLVSHRGEAFAEMYERVRATLRGLTGAENVALLAGSGTSANDAVAAGLALAGGRGVILVNGEFGRRLTDQAHRAGLKFETVEWPWGSPWDLARIGEAIGGADWVWGVHSESSTGVLNDLDGLIAIAHRRGVRVCADCISSLGAVPLDLRDLHLATGASGKALGSVAGVAIVFASAEAMAARGRLPSSLDFADAAATRGPRFTVASPLIAALDRALARGPRFGEQAALGCEVRRSLRALGAEPLAPESAASPVLTTFAPPFGYTPEAFALVCRALGFEIHGSRSYLGERGLTQIATMGDVQVDDVRRLFDGLARWSRLAA